MCFRGRADAFPSAATAQSASDAHPRPRDRVARSRPRLRAVAILSLVALVACGPEPSGTGPVAADDWHEFSGSWNGAGTRHAIQLGGGRRASLIDLSGTMLLAGPSRPGVGFRAQVIALGDTATGLVGRAVWTDQDGNQVFSELRGEGTAAANRIVGTFIGGTGRYTGAAGSYEFAWQYVLEAEDGTVQGRTMGLKGRVRVGPPTAPSATPEAKP